MLWELNRTQWICYEKENKNALKMKTECFENANIMVREWKQNALRKQMEGFENGNKMLYDANRML
jgi:hypothetical protein